MHIDRLRIVTVVLQVVLCESTQMSCFYACVKLSEHSRALKKEAVRIPFPTAHACTSNGLSSVPPGSCLRKDNVTKEGRKGRLCEFTEDHKELQLK